MLILIYRCKDQIPIVFEFLVFAACHSLNGKLGKFQVFEKLAIQVMRESSILSQIMKTEKC